MQLVRTALAASLALLAAVSVDGCADVTFKAKGARRMVYGKKVQLKAVVRNTGRTPFQGLYLSVQLPAGVGYAGTSKSLPQAPVVWGSNAQYLYWPLPTLNKKSSSFSVNLNLTTCLSASQAASLPVSIFELDGVGNQICVKSTTLQVGAG